MDFPISPAPHAPPRIVVPSFMRRVMYALVPAALAYTWFFGFGLFFNILIACLFALVAEAAVLKLRRRAMRQPLNDGSALVTAVLLGFALPPLTPWWIPAFGAVAAIVLGKQLYGGLGKNLFNPAMVGYVLLLVSFPVQMTQWLPPRMGDIDYHRLGFVPTLRYSLTGALPPPLTVDALTRATPLDLVKEGLREHRALSEIRAGSLFGDLGGRGWEWINNFIALGGLYLLYTGTIRWQIPASLLVGILVPAAALHVLSPDRYVSAAFTLFSGATLLGAFFIATDPVSAATTDRGRLIYGTCIGLLTYVIRTWGGYPDGLAFAVLLMNAAVPLIDRYTKPRIYGHG